MASETFEDIFGEFHKDPEYRKQDRTLRPFYDLVVQIIQRRNELKLTQKDLAKKAGTFQSRISKIEAAEYDIRLSTLIQIAEALDTEVVIQLCPISELEPIDGTYKKLFNVLASTGEKDISEVADIHVEFANG